MEDWARPVVAFEIRGRDNARLQHFYGALFNWQIEANALGFAQIAAGIGGPEPGPVGFLLKSEAPGITLFVQVLDLRSSLEKAKQLGGSVLAEPFQVPNGPAIARIADPEGTPVGLIQQ
jgi:predicted enzyme related to lactoylglutathione lyase